MASCVNSSSNNNKACSSTEENSEPQETNINNLTTDVQEEDDDQTVQEQTGLSKNQLRKLRKREKWLSIKVEKRKQERAKRKKRYADARLQGISLGPTRKSLKLNSMKNSNCHVRVAVDCSFDDLMSEKDVMKLVKQLQSCYSVNRRAENPMQFYVCGISGQTEERLDNIGDCKNWDVHFTAENYKEKFEKSEIVYLSSESENILTTLEDNKVYVIGGLVDHNHHKGLCHRLAVENEIFHAQLPISEYIQLKSRKVLTVNHVFEILLRYTEAKDWKESFCRVIPERKGIVPLSCEKVSEKDLRAPNETKDSIKEFPESEVENSEELNDLRNKKT